MIIRLALAGLLAVTLVSAQGKGGGKGGGSKGGGDMGMSMPRITVPLDVITETLKLDKDQKKEVKNILDEAQKEATPLHDQILKSRDSIADAVAGGKDTADLVKSESALEGAMASIEMHAFAKIYAALTPEQKTPNTSRVFLQMKGIFNGKNWNATQ